jgi:putative aldouronate transport system substrate-binding protein
MQMKVVCGEKPLDAFDAWVKDWKASGGDQITAEVNAWYKATR